MSNTPQRLTADQYLRERATQSAISLLNHEYIGESEFEYVVNIIHEELKVVLPLITRDSI